MPEVFNHESIFAALLSSLIKPLSELIRISVSCNSFDFTSLSFLAFSILDNDSSCNSFDFTSLSFLTFSILDNDSLRFSSRLLNISFFSVFSFVKLSNLFDSASFFSLFSLASIFSWSSNNVSSSIFC